MAAQGNSTPIGSRSSYTRGVDNYDSRVVEVGQPLKARYLATRKSDGMFYMEVRYHKRQARKWMKPERVTLGNVEQVFIEKVSELAGRN